MVSFDNAICNDQWRIEKMCLTAISPSYIQTLLIASIVVLVLIVVVASVALRKRKTK